MEQGVETHISDFSPKAGADERRVSELAAEEAKLREKVTEMATMESEEGWRLRALVVDALERRIDTLVKNDPEACAYVSIIHSMGYHVHAGREAVAALVKRAMGETETKAARASGAAL